MILDYGVSSFWKTDPGCRVSRHSVKFTVFGTLTWRTKLSINALRASGYC